MTNTDVDTSRQNIVMLLRILANPPRPRDSRNTRATWATYAGEALGVASALEQQGTENPTEHKELRAREFASRLGFPHGKVIKEPERRWVGEDTVQMLAACALTDAETLRTAFPELSP